MVMLAEAHLILSHFSLQTSHYYHSNNMVESMRVIWALCEVFLCVWSKMYLVEFFREVDVFACLQKFLADCLQRTTVATSTSVFIIKSESEWKDINIWTEMVQINQWQSPHFWNIFLFEWSFYENVWRREKSLKMSGFEGIFNWLPLYLRYNRALKKLNIFKSFNRIWKMNSNLNVDKLWNISEFEWRSFSKHEWQDNLQI